MRFLEQIVNRARVEVTGKEDDVIGVREAYDISRRTICFRDIIKKEDLQRETVKRKEGALIIRFGMNCGSECTQILRIWIKSYSWIIDPASLPIEIEFSDHSFIPPLPSKVLIRKEKDSLQFDFPSIKNSVGKIEVRVGFGWIHNTKVYDLNTHKKTTVSVNDVWRNLRDNSMSAVRMQCDFLFQEKLPFEDKTSSPTTSPPICGTETLQNSRGTRDAACGTETSGYSSDTRDAECGTESTSAVNCAFEDILTDFENMFVNHIHSDVLVRVADETIPAHKNVLAARSPVFAVMFQQDMTETNTGFVHIHDCRWEVFHEFLKFLYCGKLEEKDSDFEKIIELMLVADKYQVSSLKNKCSLILRSLIRVNNACDILSVADSIADVGLKTLVLNFMTNNAEQVLNSSEWSKWLTTKTVLATEVFAKLAKKFSEKSN